MARLDKMLLERPFPRVKLHPATLKHLKRGHPWVTRDRFSEDFPKDRPFLIGLGAREDQEQCLLLHDPHHPKIKARLWSQHGDFIEQIKKFPYQLRQRFIDSFKRRVDLLRSQERENICLVFAENDFIPGLQITLFKETILTQIYTNFWFPFKATIIEEIQRAFKDLGVVINLEEFWFQERNHGQKPKFERYSKSGKKLKLVEREIIINEFGGQYLVRLNKNYDLGLYTDMSAYRKKLGANFSHKTILNLYAYTGAFSIHALKNDADEVHSVDISQEALSWLEQNLNLNQEIEKGKHFSHNVSVKKSLKAFNNESKKFDWIICDPPSASSDGKKMINALKAYQETLPLMLSCLNKTGRLVVFLNTHQVSAAKLKKHIQELLQLTNTHKIYQVLKNQEDCQPLPQFPEGHHIKGLVIGPNIKEKL